MNIKINTPNVINQKGFTLVELLVGLLISLFILIVVVTFLVTSARNLVNKSSEDLIQENARFAFEILASNIRLSGVNQSTLAQAFTEGIFDDPICDGNLDCNRNEFAYQLNGQNINSDSIGFDYIINNGVSCTGSQINQQTKVVTAFFIADLDADNIPSLYCRSYEATLDPISQSFVNYQEPNPALPIIDGIDMLQIQYGVDANNDGVIERYTAYDNLAANDRADVRAIKIGLLVNSGQTIAGDQNVIDTAVQRTYQVFDGTYQITDGLLRQIYSTTVFLPNRT